jgi:hypothetical protein
MEALAYLYLEVEAEIQTAAESKQAAGADPRRAKAFEEDRSQESGAKRSSPSRSSPPWDFLNLVKAPRLAEKLV